MLIVQYSGCDQLMAIVIVIIIAVFVIRLYDSYSETQQFKKHSYLLTKPYGICYFLITYTTNMLHKLMSPILRKYLFNSSYTNTYMYASVDTTFLYMYACTLCMYVCTCMYVCMYIREYGSTLYVGMARKKNGRPYISIASDELKSLVIYTDKF